MRLNQMIKQVPLAWLQLTHQTSRFIVAIAGVTFAVALMFMNYGFQSALFNSASLLQSSLNGDIFLIHRRSSSLVSMRQFSQRRLYQALACPGVTSIGSVYLGFTTCHNHESRGTSRILVIGISPTTCPLNLKEVLRNRNELTMKDTVLFDRLSRKEFGPVEHNFTLGQPIDLELGNHKVTVVGLFNLGTSFGADGNLVTSESNFFRLGFQHTRKPGLIDIGVITVSDKTQIAAVQGRLTRSLPDDVLVLTKPQFIQFEQMYWRNNTAIGFIFSLGVALGLVVGGAIVYQILYSDVNEHLSEYATLKAIGYSDRYLFDVVLQEAILLATIGFGPGYLSACILYRLTRDVTGLPMYLDAASSIFFAALTIVMCCLSGMLAARRINTADPAEVFS